MKKTNMKTTSLIFTGMILGIAMVATPKMAHAQSSSLEYTDGPSAKLDLVALNDISAYAKNANRDISRLLNSVTQSDDSVEIKNKLYSGISSIIANTKDTRAVLLLTQSLQAGMTLVKLIEQQSINRGVFSTPQGTVDQQIRIMKKTLTMAKDYYESDYSFIEGVMQRNETKSNPKFVEFGMKLNKFVIEMSNGVLNARVSYGMIRWSLAVLANYIKNDNQVGIAYASTRYNLAKELSALGINGAPIYPDLVNGDQAPSDVQCLAKIRNLKFLAQQSASEMNTVETK